MDYESLRRRYKPRQIAALFIAESPPAPRSNRFFYLEGVTRADALYLETMRVLFPEMTSKQTAKQIRSNKAFYLTAFKDKGFYLIDATDTPIAGMSKSRKLATLAHDRELLQEKVRGLIEPGIPLVLITTTVWESHHAALRQLGYSVANLTAIPHPAFGNSRKFSEGLLTILRLRGLL
ncbi:MAG TPA: hypothetical protein VLK23_08830 [Thermodesulfobacteriota bacterium]|nr:hypothetical protein [Thermodesulfobacteriota bacterium]